MADRELVIKISEEEYINIKNAINSLIENGVERVSMSKVCLAILDATPLPRCKDCKYFEYDSVAKVDGVPLIVAHEICNRWGDGCKTNENGYCFLAESEAQNGETAESV